MYKIKSDDKKAKSIKRLEAFERDRKAIAAEKGVEAADLYARTFQSHIDELKEAIHRHDRLREGGVPPFHGTCLEDLGHHLVDARVASNWTQQELADKIGVSQPMVFKYENSDYQGYGIDILQRVSDALGVRLDVGARKVSAPPAYWPLKQESAILYFLNEIPNSYLGKTKLNKLLYYVDFDYYQRLGQSVTGDRYLAHRYGPVPEHAEMLLKQLEAEGKIHSESVMLGDKLQVRYFAKVLPDLAVFSNEEKSHLQDIAKRFEFWTASQMTAQTHEEYPWRATSFGSVIPYELAHGLETPSSQEEP